MRRTVVLLLLLTGLASAEDGMPTEDEFSRSVMTVVQSYATDGSHGYYWPKGDNWPGTTCDLEYRGTRVCEADAKGRCYCCGLTFEVFTKAWKAWCEGKKSEFRIPGIDGKGLLSLRSDWFGATGDEKRSLQQAIVSRKLGRAIERLEDARAGDFVQLWRKSGSGHSVVFIEWKRDGEGRPKALRYWSTQKSTNGIGYREENLGGADGIDPGQVYLVRVGRK